MASDQWCAAQLTRRYPMLQYLTDRPFGIEIEFFGLDYLIYPGSGQVIRPYNVQSRSMDGEPFRKLSERFKVKCGEDESAWHLETDESLKGSGGAELISPILSGIEGLVEAYRAFQMLRQIQGVQINETCGLHVHHGVDRAIFGCRELQRLVRFIYPLEDYFYLLIPGNRQEAATCRPMELDLEAFMKECPVCDPDVCPVKAAWYSPENRFDLDFANFPRYDKTRYHGLNLHSYWFRGTVEFRHHSAVLHEIDEAMQWIIFTQMLVEMASGFVPEIYYVPNFNKWMSTIVKIYLTFKYRDRIHWVEPKEPL